MANRSRRVQICRSLAFAALLFVFSRSVPDARAADSPYFRLVPDRGACVAPDPLVAAQSGQFPPGMVIVIQFRWDNVRPDMRFGGYLPRQTVKPDGTLDVQLILKNCSPVMPDGAVMVIYVDEYLGNTNLGVARTGQHFATVTFTVDRSGAQLPGLPSTGGGAEQRRLSPQGGGGLAALLLTLAFAPRWVQTRESRRKMADI